ncbi:hypothetical protein VNO77_19622 [Canavalia gladiata]|uniref:Uncharacterized protein n=1 Tax=Canavalia gladiata TaxID=3824 RepID=A0AAN9LN43_CANGL
MDPPNGKKRRQEALQNYSHYLEVHMEVGMASINESNKVQVQDRRDEHTEDAIDEEDTNMSLLKLKTMDQQLGPTHPTICHMMNAANDFNAHVEVLTKIHSDHNILLLRCETVFI